MIPAPPFTCPTHLLTFILPWLPRTASEHGPAIDGLMHISLICLFALCVLAQAFIVAGLFLRREGKPRFSAALRWTAIGLIVIFFAWMTVVAEQLWSVVRLAPAVPNALRVQVTGVQFQWYFRYPGPDGIYGRTRANLIDPAAGNPLGLDPADPHGRDDVVSSILVLPVGREVDLKLDALDVIHGFYVPAMRVMQNATPGKESEIHLTPTRTGDFPIVCSQLCGLGHYRMRAVLRVVTERQFIHWMNSREAELTEQ